MPKLIIFMIPMMMGIASLAQSQLKTVQLDEIVVEALPFEKYISGSKIEKSDSLSMAILGQKTLSDYMQQNTTVYIKEQGNKMLASVSFRGTGASHTGVFWHGVNLNSLTLGSTDFNGVPLFLFDDIAVHYGGASSLHGSDAIGGSIHLSSVPSWTDGVNVQIRQDFGSFGNVFTGAKLNIGNGKWESKTRVFNRLLKNNFTYTITDRIGDTYKVEQENAEVHNYGLLQEFNGKVSKAGYLSIKGWVGENYHEIQPLMVTHPEQVQNGDEILEKNLRLIASYDHFFDKGTLNSGIGYVWDYQLFNDSDLIETKRTLANLSYEWNLSEKTTLKAGGNTTYIVPDVWSYTDDLTEWRGDVFLSLNHELVKNWQVNLNARKTFVPFTEAPIAPSFSSSYLINKGNTSLTFRAQVERSYRVPTFNDRYWGDQGRPDLKSEQGYSFELGHNFQQKFNSSVLEFDVSAYYMKVDDWIAWKPAGNVWRPFNLKKVEATGIELNGKFKQSIGNVDFELGGLYAYNRSVLLEGISENDPAVGYQLPYTPKHRAVLYANLIYKSYRFSMNNNYTGSRYGIDVINEEIDDFLITDIGVSKNFSFGNQLLSLEGQVLNVFDVEYQNVKRYAMPGRNYLISVNYIFNK